MKSFLLKYGVSALITVAVLAGVGTLVKSGFDSRLHAATAAYDHTIAGLTDSLTANRATLAEGARLLLVSDAAGRARVVAVTTADSARIVARTLRAALVPLVAEDSTTEVYAAADVDALLAADSAEVAALTSGLAASAVQISALSVSLDSARVAYARLVGAVHPVVAAANAVVKAARPSFLQRVLPSYGIGVAAGIDARTHAPAVVIGVTASWRL